jgi:ABC-type transport system involved in cytochrome c biogenesis ATPase subunit
MIRVLKLHVGEARHLRNVSLEFAPTGITIVHGPNEVGKSTLVACVGALLRHRSTSQKEELKSLRSPSGAVEVGARLRLEHGRRTHEVELLKRWFHRPMTQLVVDGDVIEGREAEHRFEELLAEVGIGAPADEPLVRWLYQPQGTLAPTSSSLRASEVLARALQRTSGTEELVPGWLLERARAELARYETPQRHESTGELRSAEQHVTALRERLTSSEDRLLAAEQLVAQIRDLELELAALPRELEEREREEAALLARANELRAALAAEPERAELRAIKHRELEELTRTRQRQAELARLLAEQTDELGRLQRLRGQVRADLDTLGETRRAIETELAKLREQLPAARTQHAEALRYERRELARRELDELRTRLERLEGLRSERATLEAHAPRPVPATEVERLRQLDAEISAARTSLRERGPRLAVRSEAPATVEIDSALAEVAPGAPLERSVVDPVTVRVGPITITVTPGTVREHLSALEAERAQLLAELDVDDLVQAIRVQKEGQRHAERLEELARRIEDLAPEHEERRWRERLSELEPQLATPAPPPPPRSTAELELKLEKLEGLAERATQERDRLEQEQRRLEARRDELDQAASRLEIDLTSTRTSLEHAEAPDELDQRIGELATELAQLDAVLAELAERRAALDLCEQELGAVRQELQRRRERKAQAEVLLEHSRASLATYAGTFDAVALAREELQDARARLERLHAQRQAAVTLLRALEEANQAVRARTQAPYRELLELLLTRVLGEEVEVMLDDNLDVSGIRRPQRSQEILRPGELSAGTQEQLALAVRFAATRLTGAVPVLLDDVLGFSDAQRSRRLVLELEALADEGQAIVFTAHPERYESAGGVRRVALDGEAPGTSEPPGGDTVGLRAEPDRAPSASEEPQPRPSQVSRAGAHVKDRTSVILELLADVGRALSRREVADALAIDPEEASSVLRALRDAGAVRQEGERRGARYRLATPDPGWDGTAR